MDPSTLQHRGISKDFYNQLKVCLLQVNPEMKDDFEKNGLQFVGQDVEGERMEIIELDGEWKSLIVNV